MNIRNTTAIFLALFSLNSFSSVWVGLDYGISSISEKSEDHKEKEVMGAKIFYAKKFKLLNLDLGFGVERHLFSTEYDSGIYGKGKFDSEYGYLYLAPNYYLNNRFSLSMENKILVKNVFKSSHDVDQRVFTGLGLRYDIPLSKEIKTRIVATAQQGLNFDRSTQLYMVGIQFGYEKSPKEKLPVKVIEEKKEVVRTYIVPSFNFDEAQLNNENREIVKSIAKQLLKTEYVVIKIIGHTDLIGVDDYNYDLSEKRAQSVKDSFVSEGIQEDSIILVPKSKNEPLENYISKESNAKNRRVVINVILNE